MVNAYGCRRPMRDFSVAWWVLGSFSTSKVRVAATPPVSTGEKASPPRADSCYAQSMPFSRLSTFFLLLLFAASAHAGILLFSSLSSPTLYDCCHGYAVTGSATNQGRPGGAGEGFSFTSAGTAFVQQIDLALEPTNVFDNTLILTLNADSVLPGGQHAPGSVLASWTVNVSGPSASCCNLQTVVPTAPVLLTAGTQYWLVGLPGSVNTFVDFLGSFSSVNMTRVLTATNGQPVDFFSQTAAFDLIGNTPEPSTSRSIAVGIIVSMICLRRSSGRNARPRLTNLH